MGTIYEELKQTKPLELEDEVYLNVLRAAEVFNTRAAELLKRFDITPAQYNVLRILKGAGAGGRMCREISERMITRDPDITKLLDRLEARKLIERKRQPNDRRVIVACLTEEGKQLVNKVIPIADADLKRFFTKLSPKELDTLNRLLEKARNS